MAESSTPPPRPPSVLLVDDETFIRNVLSLGLRRQGYNVLTAAGGREAVELFRDQHAAIDVVLLDTVMPGMDGPATLTALEAIDPGVRCCIMSGGSVPAGSGRLHSLAKPFHMNELVRILAEMLRTETVPLDESGSSPETNRLTAGKE